MGGSEHSSESTGSDAARGVDLVSAALAVHRALVAEERRRQPPGWIVGLVLGLAIFSIVAWIGLAVYFYQEVTLLETYWQTFSRESDRLRQEVRQLEEEIGDVDSDEEGE